MFFFHLQDYQLSKQPSNTGIQTKSYQNQKRSVNQGSICQIAQICQPKAKCSHTKIAKSYQKKIVFHEIEWE
jgi:hypothetical protein